MHHREGNREEVREKRTQMSHRRGNVVESLLARSLTVPLSLALALALALCLLPGLATQALAAKNEIWVYPAATSTWETTGDWSREPVRDAL